MAARSSIELIMNLTGQPNLKYGRSTLMRNLSRDACVTEKRDGSMTYDDIDLQEEQLQWKGTVQKRKTAMLLPPSHFAPLWSVKPHFPQRFFPVLNNYYLQNSKVNLAMIAFA